MGQNRTPSTASTNEHLIKMENTQKKSGKTVADIRDHVTGKGADFPSERNPVVGAAALKEMRTYDTATKEFDGPKYSTVADAFVTDPNFVIDLPQDPANPTQVTAWKAGQIPPKILSKFADREHLVEPQSIVAFLTKFKEILSKSPTFKEDDFFNDLGAPLQTMSMVDYDGNEVPIEGGTFFDILGHGLNSKANLERLVKPANILKAMFQTTNPDKDYGEYSGTYGNVPVGRLLQSYLAAKYSQMYGAALAIHTVFLDQMEWQKGAGHMSQADYNKMKAELDSFRELYDNNHQNSLYQRVTRAIAKWNTMGRTNLPPTNVDYGPEVNQASNQAWALNRLFENGAAEYQNGGDGTASMATFDAESKIGKTKTKPQKKQKTNGATSSNPNPNGLTTQATSSCPPKKTRRRRRGLPLFRRDVILAKGVSCSASGTSFINSNNEEVDTYGNTLDEWGNPINDEGDYVDENNVAINAYGDKLDDFDVPTDEDGDYVDENGDVGEKQASRTPRLRCSSNRSFAQCRNKLIRQREVQKPKDKEEMRSWESQMGDNYGKGDGDVSGAAKDTLSQIKSITGDDNILPYGPDGYDESTPSTIYTNAETLDDVWDSIGESFESAIADNDKRSTLKPQIKSALLAWKKYNRQLIVKLQQVPREQRDGLKVSEMERRASEFNHALVTYNAHEPYDVAKETYDENQGEVNMEEVPLQVGDAVRSTQEVSDRSQLAALKEFGDGLGDNSILPEGTDGLGVKMDDDGNFIDEIDFSEGVIDVGDGDAPLTWDDVWAWVTERITDYIDKHIEQQIQEQNLRISQYKAFLRGVKALKKAIAFKMGPGVNKLEKAVDSITSKLKGVDRSSLQKDVTEDAAAAADTDALVKGLDTPTVKFSQASDGDGSLDPLVATNVAEDVSGPSADYADSHLDLPTYQQVLGSDDSTTKKFARSFKPIARTIARILGKNRDKVPPNALNKAQTAAVKFRDLTHKAAEPIKNAPESDRSHMPNGVLIAHELTHSLNIMGAGNVRASGDTNVMLRDTGEVVSLTPEDVPEEVSTAANAIRAKTELRALTTLRAVDSSILPKGGYDSDITNGGQVEALPGTGEYVRDLQPSEIASGLEDGDGELEAWNAVTERALGGIDQDEGYAEDGPKAVKRNAVRRYLLRAQKSIVLRDRVQKTTGPWARDNNKAILRDAQRQNHADVSRKLLTVLGSDSDPTLRSFGSTSGTKESSLDDRDADSVLSVDLVDALQNIKSAGTDIPEADDILPDGEPQTESPESSTLLPSSLARGQTSLSTVLQTAVSVSQTIANNLASEPDSTVKQQKQVKLLKAYGKLLKISSDSRTNFALGIGRLDKAGQSSALETARSFGTAANNVGDTYKANNVADGVDLAANDIPAIRESDADPQTLEAMSGAVNSSPAGVTRWQRTLKRVLNNLKKSATGKVLASSKGNMNTGSKGSTS
ncbi:hypothetical protein HDV00_003564 [Rhizophlyctis rosea]|nr:hypothetical protein HDV00_003564 [Rhizophlyctis rosea]